MTYHSHICLEENGYYHIYNRGNGGINVFYRSQNYVFFLRKYHTYLAGYVETYAYCLMPNHFHLLIKIKSRSQLTINEKGFPTSKDLDKYSTEELVSELFRRFLMSYSKAINVQEGRTGSLFQKTFRRKKIDSDVYFTRLVYYIHHQLRHHGFTDWTYETYPWSSYRRFLIDTETSLRKTELLAWFGGKEDFIKFHAQFLDDNTIQDYILEEN